MSREHCRRANCELLDIKFVLMMNAGGYIKLKRNEIKALCKRMSELENVA